MAHTVIFNKTMPNVIDTRILNIDHDSELSTGKIYPFSEDEMIHYSENVEVSQEMRGQVQTFFG